MDSKTTTRAADHKFMPATITAIFLENMPRVQGERPATKPRVVSAFDRSGHSTATAPAAPPPA